MHWLLTNCTRKRRERWFPFLSSRCVHLTLLLQNAPKLERNPSRVAIDHIARLTDRKHWPVKRETPEEWKAMKSKTKRCRVCLAKVRLTRSGEHVKTTWVCKGCPGEEGICVQKNALNYTIPNLILVSNTERGIRRGMQKCVHKLLVYLEEIFIDFRHWKNDRKDIWNSTSIVWKTITTHRWAYHSNERFNIWLTFWLI